MNQQDGVKLLNIINGFLNDDMGNKITKWNATSFGQTIQAEVNKIILKDGKELQDMKEKIQNIEKIDKKIIPMQKRD